MGSTCHWGVSCMHLSERATIVLHSTVETYAQQLRDSELVLSKVASFL